jgi:hypothetical protein
MDVETKGFDEEEDEYVQEGEECSSSCERQGVQVFRC